MTRVLTTVAAVALFVGGYEHWSLYRQGYRAIPVIGVLFALNTGASALAGVALLLRRELVVRAAGATVALTTLGFFIASRLPGGVFGFQEKGLAPAPQAAITIVAETATIVLISVSMAWDMKSRHPRGARQTRGRARAAGPTAASFPEIAQTGGPPCVG